MENQNPNLCKYNCECCEHSNGICNCGCERCSGGKCQLPEDSQVEE